MSLSNLTTYLEENTPATEFLKKELNVEDLVLICDTPIRAHYKESLDMLKVLEQKYHIVILEDTGPLQKDVEELISKFTKNAKPPHLFYKQKYFDSGRNIIHYYSTGDIERMMGLDPLVVA